MARLVQESVAPPATRKAYASDGAALAQYIAGAEAMVDEQACRRSPSPL